MVPAIDPGQVCKPWWWAMATLPGNEINPRNGRHRSHWLPMHSPIPLMPIASLIIMVAYLADEHGLITAERRTSRFVPSTRTNQGRALEVTSH